MNQTIQLKDGTPIPPLGQGTWYMGEQPAQAQEEIAALQQGLAQGLTLVDTAEMYGSGRSESLVGQAIQGTPREALYLVSKVYPHNADKGQLEQSLTQSLQRLGVDYLDLYLLHWRGSVPLSRTIQAMEEQVAKGTIKHWGVSNFDVRDMKELLALEGGHHCAVNQVLYHLGSRGIEFDLLPFLQEKQIPVMAYCPLAQAGSLGIHLLEHPTVCALAQEHQVSPGNILLSFLRTQPGVIPIPKSGRVAHVVDNAKSLSLTLPPQALAQLNQAFPKPTRKMSLDIV